ncbi:iron complex transporter substrate-binding protein [Prosthecochloris sp. GSB1]|uniref:ABC transporter substrate-binding protein n=1 Tax=Prosthecochloris sp. GSB1 TaxID=281093 RepID=UPI000B8CCA50|nr:ABC transporter substrate-binding protein [Prosthecochloris sp. GSB1]ASQ90375.1 iron complex transporter substrate-binding protein [Prosthecochloris sp. GSB1]
MVQNVYNEKVKHFRTALIAALSVFFLLAGCASGDNDSVSAQVAPDDSLRRIPFRYAKRLTMTKIGDATLIDIVKPRGAMHGLAYRYLLVPKGAAVPEGYPDALMVRTPVEKVTCGIGLHVTMLEELGILDSIVGIGRAEWVGNPEILRRLDSGKIIETGMSNAMNMETMVGLQPDLAFVYSSGGEYDVHEQLLAMGITPAVTCMHIEEHPLGVLEWIKFFGAFFGKEAEAEAFFAQTAERYEALERRVRGRFGERPGVIVGHGARGVWSTHGSSAWFIGFLQDAGADYILEDPEDYEENLISFEHAMSVGLRAEYWVNPLYTAMSLSDLVDDDSRYAQFLSVWKGNVFNNNAATFENGKNAFWEIGMSEPDVVLADLVRIFHPELLPDHELKYYRRLVK